MKRIAVIITDMFQDVEYSQPADAFRKAGHELVNVGIVSAGSIVKGEYGTLVQIDKPVRDVATDDFDALFIPGGYSPTNFVSMTTRSGSPGISSRRKSRYLQSATRHSSLSRPRYWRAARNRLEIARAGHKKCRR